MERGRDEAGTDGRRADRPHLALRWLRALLVVALFLFAVRLLGAATHALSPFLTVHLPSLVGGPIAAVGLGWLATYVLLNGSVVAALGLSLYASGVLPLEHAFLVLAGSRLGASAFVILMGALDHLKNRRGSLRESLGLGLLTLIVTHTLYLPATAAGYVILRQLPPSTIAALGADSLGLPTLQVLSGLTSGIADLLGPGLAFGVALVLFVVSLQFFDRLLEDVDADGLRDRWFGRLDNRWISYLLGTGVTTVTASVSFSIGVVVPLYNRRWIGPDRITPYVMGASLGTLADTLLVALVLGTTLGTGTVVLMAMVVAVVTAVALVGYTPYRALVAGGLEWVTGDRRTFAWAASALLAAPVLLLLLG